MTDSLGEADATASLEPTGVDEVGRGPLAGPVFAAAVTLDPRCPIEGLTDSKKLTARRRERLADAIRERALAWHVAEVDVETIDRENILRAALAAMGEAVRALRPAPLSVVVDGSQLPELSCPARAQPKADLLVPAVSAAAILAKVERDARMVELDARYPGYGLARNKGYGTAEHLAALRRLGPTPIHRRSFAPVAALLDAP